VFSLHLEWLFSQAGENGWHRNLDKDLWESVVHLSNILDWMQ
jgi:hypothetical protein